LKSDNILKNCKLNKKSIHDYIKKFSSSFENIDDEKIDQLKLEMLKRVNTSNEIFIIGNGGSAANANHIAGDYLKTFSLAGFNFKINSLSESTSYLTAASNDVDFSEVYEILINTRISKGDLLIFLSGSGNSINLIKPARIAKKVGIVTAAVVGYLGGGLKEIVDIPIHIEIQDMEISEDAQMTIFHYLKQCLFDELINDKDVSIKYKKRTNEGLIA
tara:strand:+ start:5179 stop:5829 length:651 start_codon:yes stop_codon:yes gene_type:complete